jgi:MFS superfamily sulfate permease-like transporter
VPLFVYALFASSMHLQVGAVAVVSLLTQTTVSRIVAPQSDAVAALKSAASAAAKAASTQRGNATLAALSTQAASAFNAGNVALIQTQVDTANLLAFLVGVFSIALGLLKLGSLMNLMGPAVISGECPVFAIAARLRVLTRVRNPFCLSQAFSLLPRSPSRLDS